MATAHMNPAEAVQAHQDLEAHCSIGMHFGTFRLTEAPLDALTKARTSAAFTKYNYFAIW